MKVIRSVDYVKDVDFDTQRKIHYFQIRYIDLDDFTTTQRLVCKVKRFNLLKYKGVKLTEKFLNDLEDFLCGVKSKYDGSIKF